jgi:hypothetical protein
MLNDAKCAPEVKQQAYANCGSAGISKGKEVRLSNAKREAVMTLGVAAAAAGGGAAIGSLTGSYQPYGGYYGRYGYPYNYGYGGYRSNAGAGAGIGAAVGAVGGAVGSQFMSNDPQGACDNEYLACVTSYVQQRCPPQNQVPQQQATEVPQVFEPSRASSRRGHSRMRTVIREVTKEEDYR